MTTELADGQLLGDFDIHDVAGSGGMGIIYKTTQRSLGRLVALKVIREEIAAAPEYRNRFLREARLAAAVDHPNVVTIYDVGASDVQLYLAMQWVEGEDLRTVLARESRLPIARVTALAAQIGAALDAVHHVGMVHRDVKPSNILIGTVGGTEHTYLTDFGIAKPSLELDELTQTGWTVGTVGYLAPEQIRGEAPTPRNDIYALGCVLFEALTGRRPFAGENDLALRWAHANDPRPLASATLPRLGTRYDTIFQRALAIDPTERFASGAELAQALSRAQGSSDDPTVAMSGPPRSVPTAVGPPPHPATAVSPATPLPRRDGATPQPPQMYPPYGYVTPAPVPAQQWRAGNPVVLVLLAVIALAGIAVGALAAAGVFSPSNSAPPPSHAPGKVRAHTASSTSGASGHGQTECGGDVSVGPGTSCPFGLAVEQSYLQSAGGDTTVSTYSSVTHQSYAMHCTGDTPHVCKGGNAATVYFTSSPSAHTAAPSSGSSAATSADSSGMHPCDQNISANESTSCGFAFALFKQYFADYKQNGEQSSDTLDVQSPATNQTYNMTCANDGTTVNCSGGNNAFVTYPMWAVRVYVPQ